MSPILTKGLGTLCQNQTTSALRVHCSEGRRNGKLTTTYFGAMVTEFPLGNEKSADSLPKIVALYTKGLILGFFKHIY